LDVGSRLERKLLPDDEEKMAMTVDWSLRIVFDNSNSSEVEFATGMYLLYFGVVFPVIGEGDLERWCRSTPLLG